VAKLLFGSFSLELNLTVNKIFLIEIYLYIILTTDFSHFELCFIYCNSYYIMKTNCYLRYTILINIKFAANYVYFE